MWTCCFCVLTICTQLIVISEHLYGNTWVSLKVSGWHWLCPSALTKGHRWQLPTILVRERPKNAWVVPWDPSAPSSLVKPSYLHAGYWGPPPWHPSDRKASMWSSRDALIPPSWVWRSHQRELDGSSQFTALWLPFSSYSKGRIDAQQGNMDSLPAESQLSARTRHLADISTFSSSPIHGGTGLLTHK